jgi:prepilin-type N-terminal cleavage/methylation domain-containing protein
VFLGLTFDLRSLTSEKRGRYRGFTLLEVLVVVGIISLLLVAVIPAVTSLSKSSGRKGAISNLISMIEQARSLALSDARNTYVVFATTLPGSATPQMIKEYSYRAYAVFEDTASGATKLQVTKWQKLPTGISFRSQDEPAAPGTPAGTCITGTTNTTTSAFSFSPLSGTAAITSPYVTFDSTGAVIQPTSASPMRIVVFEGSVNASGEIPTAHEASGQPVRDEIQIAKFTGRASFVTR